MIDLDNQFLKYFYTAFAIFLSNYKLTFLINYSPSASLY
jgi:hypothetical protein